MSCNATRIELSNTDTTTVQFTVTDTPVDGTVVSFQVPSLSISVSPTTTGGVASVPIPSVTATENDILDATLQVGTNAAVVAEVLVVETNEDQTIGVTISDAGVTYCAPTSGGGGGGGGTNPVYEYVYGNTDQLGELLSEDAHLSFFGDSISNPRSLAAGQGSLFTAAWFEFKPDAWRGVWLPADSAAGVYSFVTSVPAINRQTGSGAMSPSSLNRKTSSWTKGCVAISGTVQDINFQFQIKNLSTTAATRDSNLAKYPDGIRLFETSSGERNIAKLGKDFKVGAELIGVGTADFCTANVEKRFYRASGQTANWSAEPVLGGSGYWSEVISAEFPSSQDWDGNESGIGWTLQLRDQTDAKKFISESVFVGGTDPGLSMSYFGDGSFTFRSHYPPGENIDIDPGGFDTYHYDAGAMAGRMASIGTSHALIALGANDLNAALRTGEQVLADFDTMIGKLQTARPGIKIVALTVYEGVGWTEEVKAARNVYNEGLKSRAQSLNNLTVIDLAGFIENEFETNAAFASAWLHDSIHPNYTGALAMTEFIWRRVLATTGGVLSVQGKTGVVVLTADDFDPVLDSYNILIESPVNKAAPGYIIDQRVVASRTIKNVYAKTASGSCTIVLKRSATSTIATLGAGPAMSSASVDSQVVPGSYLEIEVSSAVSPVDLSIVVEYEQ